MKNELLRGIRFTCIEDVWKPFGWLRLLQQRAPPYGYQYDDFSLVCFCEGLSKVVDQLSETLHLEKECL